MSVKFTAKCACGYSEDFAFGSPSGFQPHNKSKHFPYRCMLCGIVAVDITAEELACPRGPKHTILRLEGSVAEHKNRFEPAQPQAVKVSFRERIGIRKPDKLPQTAISPEPILSVGDHELHDEPYYCPHCRKTDLRFKYTGYHAS